MKRPRVRRLVRALVAVTPVLASSGVGSGTRQLISSAADSCTPPPHPPGTPRLPGPSGIALDRQDTLYLASYEDSSVSVYSPGAAGFPTPVRTLGGRAAGWPAPVEVTVDTRREIYVVNAPAPPASYGSVTVYAPGATGNASPIRTISAPTARCCMRALSP